jgi:hypothetical protein
MDSEKLSEGAERLWQLLATYGAQTPFTAPGCRAADGWLAEMLGVTERTIRRYRAALVAAGILREQINANNALEFRLYRYPTPPVTHGQGTAMPLHTNTLGAFLMTLIREQALPDDGGSVTVAGLQELLAIPLPAEALSALSHALPHAGQPLTHATVKDGTRDSLSHQEEDTPSFTPLLINTPTPFPASEPSTSLPSDSPTTVPPRHVVRSLVESYGVFPDSAHAIANKIVQAGYSHTATEQLLKDLWQETRGQVGLMVYRLTKRPLPARHLVESGAWRAKATHHNEREASTKKMFREMLD